jgi:hypothetical protein
MWGFALVGLLGLLNLLSGVVAGKAWNRRRFVTARDGPEFYIILSGSACIALLASVFILWTER